MFIDVLFHWKRIASQSSLPLLHDPQCYHWFSIAVNRKRAHSRGFLFQTQTWMCNLMEFQYQLVQDGSMNRPWPWLCMMTIWWQTGHMPPGLWLKFNFNGAWTLLVSKSFRGSRLCLARHLSICVACDSMCSKEFQEPTLGACRICNVICVRHITHGGFLQWGHPQIIRFKKIFHYEPSILGIPHLWKRHITIPPTSKKWKSFQSDHDRPVIYDLR